MRTVYPGVLSPRPGVSFPARHPTVYAGFSLVELMVAMGVVAILALIAYPSYSQYTIQASRSAAQQFLLEVASRQEQHLLDTRRYAPSLEELNIAIPEALAKYYNSVISIDNAASPPLYLLTAAPIAGTRQETDPVLTLSSTGLRTPADHW